MSEPEGHAPATELHRDQRRDQVALLLAQGLRIRQISELLKVGSSTVHRDIQVIRRHYQARQTLSYGRKVAEEMLKLDELEKGIMVRARRGELGAIDRVLRIQERRAKLQGLDAPVTQKIEVLTEDVIDRAIRDLNEEMARDRARLARLDADDST